MHGTIQFRTAKTCNGTIIIQKKIVTVIHIYIYILLHIHKTAHAQNIINIIIITSFGFFFWLNRGCAQIGQHNFESFGVKTYLLQPTHPCSSSCRTHEARLRFFIKIGLRLPTGFFLFLIFNESPRGANVFFLFLINHPGVTISIFKKN